jgi:hypothetical protein
VCGSSNDFSRKDVTPDRRRVTGIIASALVSFAALDRPASGASVAGLPQTAAGIEIPDFGVARQAALFAQAHCPPFLFNHCMRTYLFGALQLAKKRQRFDPEIAFSAAALHDLGLLPAFASRSQSFEIDGANAAESLALRKGGAAKADAIWHAVELHDNHWPLIVRQGPEAQLVALGAACDVDGANLAAVGSQRVQAVLAAFPRLSFKKQFAALLEDHCRRKPLSQTGTWLEGLCRKQVPSAWHDSTEQDINAAPFPD